MKPAQPEPRMTTRGLRGSSVVVAVAVAVEGAVLKKVQGKENEGRP